MVVAGASDALQVSPRYNGVAIWRSPDQRSEVVRHARRQDTLTLVGEGGREWLHVRFPQGDEGYVRSSAVREDAGDTAAPRALAETPLRRAASDPAESPTPSFRGHCGSGLGSRSRFCPRCGAPHGGRGTSVIANTNGPSAAAAPSGQRAVAAVTTTARPAAAGAHDLLRSALARAVSTDRPLINWWLFVLLGYVVPSFAGTLLALLGVLSFSSALVTLGLMVYIAAGVFGLVVLCQRIDRRDRHFARMADLFAAALVCTADDLDRAADSTGKRDPALDDLVVQLSADLGRARTTLLAPKGWPMALVLGALTFGLAWFWVLHFLTRDWFRLQQFEGHMVDSLSEVWLAMGTIREPIGVSLTAPDRSYWMYFFLTFLTLGLWGVYWDYGTHTDPDRVFAENRRWEVMVRRALLNG
jgi:hypothetical protein